MTRPVSHPATGRRMDISSATPEDIRFLKELKENLPHKDHGLICETAGGDQRVYVVRRPSGGYSVRHYAGSGHEGSHDVKPESDEHKRGKDYHLGELDRFGLPAAPEVSTDNRTKHDVATLEAPRIVAVEFQAFSEIDVSDYKSRTTRAMRATAFRGQYARPLPDGVLPIWVHAFGMPRGWSYPVPSIAAQDTRWDAMPKPGSVTAIGVRSIEAERCKPGSRWSACPRTGKNWCGHFHPLASLRPGFRVGEVAAMAGTTELVPIRYHTGAVYLVPAGDAARYAELGGASGYTAGAAGERISDRRLGPCNSLQHDAAPVAQDAVIVTPRPAPSIAIGQCDVPGCRVMGRPYAGEIYCPRHARKMIPRAYWEALGVPNGVTANPSNLLKARTP